VFCLGFLVKYYQHEHFNIPKLHSIQHYLDAILALGTTGGFNSENPKCLHIDLAKEVYCASNMCDYMEQMAVWLQHQEVVCLCILYLLWHYPAPSITGTDDSVDMDEDGNINTATGISAAESPLPITWHVAKWPAFANQPIPELEAPYGAVDFLPMFSEFIWYHAPCAFTPSKYD
jgi:hypothetical protein